MKLVRIIRCPFDTTSLSSQYFNRVALFLGKSEEPFHGVLCFPNGKIDTVPDVNTTKEVSRLKNMSSFEVMNNELWRAKTLLNYYACKSDRLNNAPDYTSARKVDPESTLVIYTERQLLEIDTKIKSYQVAIQLLEIDLERRDDEEALLKIWKVYQSKSKKDFFKTEIGILPVGTTQTLF